MTAPIDRSSVPCRAHCETIATASWYTDAVLKQTDFGECVVMKPEVEALAKNLLAYKDFIFKSHDFANMELKTVLGYRPPHNNNSVSTLDPTNIPKRGGAKKKLNRLLICYRLLDRIWLYSGISQNSNIIARGNTLAKSALKPTHYRHIEDIKALLYKFRDLLKAYSKKRPMGGDQSIMDGGHIYGPRLPPGSGVVQQLKDLVQLGQVNKLRKIERNFLLTALSLNWLAISPDPNQQVVGTSRTHQINDGVIKGQKADVETDENTGELITVARNASHFSDTEMDILKTTFLYEESGTLKVSNIHRSAHMAFAVTPLFLLAPVEIDKSRYALANIHDEANALGNWSSPLLIQIESTILESVFALAKGSMNVREVFAHILNTLPWVDIDALASEDPTNVRYRGTDNAPSQDAPLSVQSQYTVAPYSTSVRQKEKPAQSKSTPIPPAQSTSGRQISPAASTPVQPTSVRPTTPALSAPVRQPTPPPSTPIQPASVPESPTSISVRQPTPTPSTPVQLVSFGQKSPPRSVRQTTPSARTPVHRTLAAQPTLSPHTPSPRRSLSPLSSLTSIPSKEASPIYASSFQPPVTRGREEDSDEEDSDEEEQSPNAGKGKVGFDEENSDEEEQSPATGKGRIGSDEEDSEKELASTAMDIEEDSNDDRERNDGHAGDDMVVETTHTVSSKQKKPSLSGRTGNDMDVDVPQTPRRNPPRTAASSQLNANNVKKQTVTRQSGKRKRDSNMVKSSEFVREDTPVDDILASIRNTPFPEGLKIELAEPSLEVADEPVPLLELPAMTVFCPEGNAREIIFRAHNDFMLKFWKTHAKKIEDLYVGGQPLHKANPETSAFTVVSYSDMQTMPTTARLKLLRRGHIIETGRPIKPISFDKIGMTSLQHSLDGVLDIQDQSIDGSADMNNWLQQGTLRMLLQCKDTKALNALDIPMPEGPHNADEVSTDTAAWWETLRSPWNVDPNVQRPISDIRWGVCTTAGAGHPFHLDSDGASTYVEVLTGVKVWFVLRPKDINKIGDYSEFRQIDSFMGDHFDVLDAGENSVEAVVLTPGTRLYMHPNTMHAVYTSESAICYGGHFFATSTMKDTLCGLIQAFVAPNYVTNTYHAGSRLLLRRIITLYFDGLEQNKFHKDDPVREHLPKLRPLEKASDDPEVNSMQAVEDLFSACCLAIFSNVLDPQTYWHPEVDIGSELNDKQQEEMDRYDRNAMSVDERYACANTRGLAYKLLDWFSAHYQLIHLDKDSPQETREILDSKLAQQAYVIYLAKQKATEEDIEGFSQCSLFALEKQLRGVFEPMSKAHTWLEDAFKHSHELSLLHADFSKWSVKVTTPTDAYVPTPKKAHVFVKTPLDCKFEQGFKVNFDTSDEPPKTKSKTA